MSDFKIDDETRLNFDKMLKESGASDNTTKIRQLKHSDKIREQITLMMEIKKKYPKIIQEIRGVGLSKGTLDFLFELGWIRPKGRRQTPGRPGTWGTTDDFLDHFSINSINDLPGIEELKAAGLLEKGSFRNIYGETGDFYFEGEDKSDKLDNS